MRLGESKLMHNTTMGPIGNTSGESAARSLSTLIQGVAGNLPEIDAETYRAFREHISSVLDQVPEKLPDAERMALVREVIREVGNYRAGSERSLRVTVTRWRILAAKLVREVVAGSGVNATSDRALQLLEKVETLTTSTDVEHYSGMVDEFLRNSQRWSDGAFVSQLTTTDQSTTNDNAAGLRGGGSAVEQVGRIIENNGNGFVTLFRIGCLDVISERYGMDAVADCLITVASHLTRSLRREDGIFHWSDSSLLALLRGRPNEQIVYGEVQRIASQNREITIQIGGRMVMLHVPLSFEIVPISSLISADELYNLSIEPVTTR